MIGKTFLLSAASAAAVALVALAPAPASALTMKECSTKYQAAKSANKLKGQSWNAFRKAECADDDASDNDAAAAVTDTPAAAPAAAPAGAGSKPATSVGTTNAAKPAPMAKAKPAVFPKTISQKYSDETPGKARLKSCADQYNANKATNANGELKWIEKGGGYWSQCNAKLKAS